MLWVNCSVSYSLVLPKSNEIHAANPHGTMVKQLMKFFDLDNKHYSQFKHQTQPELCKPKELQKRMVLAMVPLHNKAALLKVPGTIFTKMAAAAANTQLSN